MESYESDVERYGLHAAGEGRDQRRAGHHARPDGMTIETVSQPVKEHDDL
ncbi:MAG: Fe-S-binding domain-containing protein, partial [Akkermansiaceae bacterium]|nr:Fe-S-binding domain-containing protein [Akkermansiaceae bacterium]